jgi:hypothetical protein
MERSPAQSRHKARGNGVVLDMFPAPSAATATSVNRMDGRSQGCDTTGICLVRVLPRPEPRAVALPLLWGSGQLGGALRLLRLEHPLYVQPARRRGGERKSFNWATLVQAL